MAATRVLELPNSFLTGDWMEAAYVGMCESDWLVIKKVQGSILTTAKLTAMPNCWKGVEKDNTL